MNLTFSEKIYKCLISKVLIFNQRHESSVTLDQLIRVYKRGEKATDFNWQPLKTKAQCAMARVNMFLRLSADREVKKNYLFHDIDIVKGTDRTYEQEEADPFWDFSDLDFTSARTDLLLANIADKEGEQTFHPPALEEE
tara:strand:- start:576 stop:992 length:417 start_codon:yes stop_codon:yes gene_type:complete